MSTCLAAVTASACLFFLRMLAVEQPAEREVSRRARSGGPGSAQLRPEPACGSAQPHSSVSIPPPHLQGQRRPPAVTYAGRTHAAPPTDVDSPSHSARELGPPGRRGRGRPRSLPSGPPPAGGPAPWLLASPAVAAVSITRRTRAVRGICTARPSAGCGRRSARPASTRHRRSWSSWAGNVLALARSPSVCGPAKTITDSADSRALLTPERRSVLLAPAGGERPRIQGGAGPIPLACHIYSILPI